jgi:succinoglycan biosynthesis protein ExoO
VPVVSFAVACYNAREFLEACVASALAQRGVEVEVLLVDDHSSDGSEILAAQLAAADPRVRFFRTERNSGPSGARNLALKEARGEWFAVLDSDDLIHPDRTARLLASVAEAGGADMVADDLILFDHEQRDAPELFLGSKRAISDNWIGLPDYLAETRMFGPHPNLGFLKPMFRRAFLRTHDIAYDEALRIAEDDALVIRALRAGARYRLHPEPLYFYRKHGASTSHRLETAPADAMLAANALLLEQIGGFGEAAPAMRKRYRAMRRAWAYTHVLEALRKRDLAGAIGRFLRDPGSIRLAHQPIAARIARKLEREKPALAAADRPVAVVISKQRISGSTNGSSRYLLAIAGAIAGEGIAVHLVQPSASLFGRTPFFRLGKELDVFGNVRIARSWRAGRTVIARDPGVWIGAMRGMISRLAGKVGLGSLWPDRKAPYSVATPWQREDRAFVAAASPLQPDFAIADYLFCAEAFPYLLDSRPRTAIVMHDRFSARSVQFGDAQDSVAALDEAQEVAGLAKADAVIAIQADEAQFLRNHVPGTEPLLVPMPADCVARPSVGGGDRVLFVGSDTAPNILGLRWFLDEVWPQLRAARPQIKLDVAGSVRNAFPSAPDGVTFHGIVPDLAALYNDAGVVISPLRQGSGLKIKLIEALAHGKACVVTGVTLQGVEHLAGAAVVRADDPAGFAAAILRLLGDSDLRAGLAEQALASARERFGYDAAFRELRHWLGRSGSI